VKVVSANNVEPQPGVFPYNPAPCPDPGVTPEPERREDPGKEDEHDRDPQHGKRVVGKTKGAIESMKEIGSTTFPEVSPTFTV
jgi:hypothetical protein